jgi:hypothetical protein
MAESGTGDGSISASLSVSLSLWDLSRGGVVAMLEVICQYLTFNVGCMMKKERWRMEREARKKVRGDRSGGAESEEKSEGTKQGVLEMEGRKVFVGSK